jgi:hypothetical protein
MSNVISPVTKLEILGGNQYSLLIEVTAFNLLVSVTVVRRDRSSTVGVGSGLSGYVSSLHDVVSCTYLHFHSLALTSHYHKKFMLWRPCRVSSRCAG